MVSVLIFLGSPGSGKGTQALRLSEAFGYQHISIGDMLRQNVDEVTELGKKASEYINLGKLVPDNLIIEMVEFFFRNLLEKKPNKVILDGFPRTQTQAEALEKIINELELNLASVIYLDVQDAVVMSRLSERGRKDDSPDLVMKRLQVYRDQTEPLLKFYANKNVLLTVDGNQPPEEVFIKISESIKVQA